MKKYLQFSRKEILALLFLALVVNIFAGFYVKLESGIYYWDNLLYWNEYIATINGFKILPSETIKALLYNIRHHDYSNLGILFLIPVGIFFGTSRLAYILSIVNLLFIPTIFAFWVLTRLILDKYLSKKPTLCLTSISLIIAALFHSIWKPLLRGDIAVGGLFFLFIATGLFLLKKPGKRKMWDYLVISLPLLIAVLYRRWYLVWTISFYISVAISDLFYTIQNIKRKKIKLYINNIFYWVVSASSFLILFILVAKPQFMKIATNNYSELYHPYRYTNSFISYLKKVFQQIGIYYLALYFSGLFVSFKNTKSRSFGIFLVGIFFLPIIFFYYFHDFVIQHYYLITPAILISSFFSLLLLVKNGICKKRGVLVFSIVLFSFLNIFLIFYDVSRIINLKQLNSFLPERELPLQRSDINELFRLTSTLNSLDEGLIYPLSSSYILNSDIFNNPNINKHPGGANLSNRIISPPEVDTRDIFSVNTFFSARYIVLAVPFQTHLKPNDQDFILIPADFVSKNEGENKLYKNMQYEFNLENETKIYIFEKIKEPTLQEITDFTKLIEMGK